MKNFFKILAILMMVMMMIIPTVALADAGVVATPDAGATIPEPLIEYALQIVATLFITMIGVLGTWLTMQLGKSTKLKNVNAAQKELIKVAKITVGELQQSVVNDLKAARDDGKLLPGEIKALQNSLIEKSLSKLSGPAYALLSAAAVDIEGMILGVGDAWIDKLKNGGADPTASDA